MFDKSAGTDPVSFGARLAGSRAFSALFRDGMRLVEETAAYLDGAGRRESKQLGRTAALAYASESMRLTTRLMQLASWLLLHRAVNDGDMSLAQAGRAKAKVNLSGVQPADGALLALLPSSLCNLIERSLALQQRVWRLDATIHARIGEEPGANPVEHQFERLKAAFERES
jgi:regulator of CtrA degradation